MIFKYLLHHIIKDLGVVQKKQPPKGGCFLNNAMLSNPLPQAKKVSP